jgi:hypothetical protein
MVSRLAGGSLRRLSEIACYISYSGNFEEMMRSGLLCGALLLVIPLVAAQKKKASPSQTEKMCGLQTYHDSLDLAFRQATTGHGQTLVTLQVLPSFQREYALVVKQEGSELKLLRAIFRDQLWQQLGPPLHVNKTRQECLDQAKTAEMDIAITSATSEQVNSLWSQFAKTSLESDSCPRRHGQCVFPMDGTSYVVQTADGRSIRVTEIGHDKTVRSENPTLLDWVHAALQVARDPRASEQH